VTMTPSAAVARSEGSGKPGPAEVQPLRSRQSR
jgi:hypothetical protein